MSTLRMTPRRKQILRKLHIFAGSMSARQLEGNSTMTRGWSRRILRELSDAGLVETTGSNSVRETVWRITDAGKATVVTAERELVG